MTPLEAALSIRWLARRVASALPSADSCAAVRAFFTRVFTSERTALLRTRRFSFWALRLIWLLMFATTTTCSKVWRGPGDDSSRRYAAQRRGPLAHSEPQRHRPHRPRQVHLGRSHPRAHRRGRRPGDESSVPRFDGHRAGTRHHDQGPERAGEVEGPR